MAKLEGKIAVVTGAASGIGLAAAKLFIAEGATVLMVDRNESDLNQSAQQDGNDVDAIVADTTKADDLARVRDYVASTYGKIDVLHANAGVAGFAPFHEVDEEAFDRIATINFKGTYFTVSSLLPVLRDGASVILTASVSGFKGSPAFSVYSATKADGVDAPRRHRCARVEVLKHH